MAAPRVAPAGAGPDGRGLWPFGCSLRCTGRCCGSGFYVFGKEDVATSQAGLGLFWAIRRCDAPSLLGTALQTRGSSLVGRRCSVAWFGPGRRLAARPCGKGRHHHMAGIPSGGSGSFRHGSGPGAGRRRLPDLASGSSTFQSPCYPGDGFEPSSPTLCSSPPAVCGPTI